ncbi:MAG: hypothetical protein M1821_002119 [Bathelium mastoideum]|nr:MAG: hypothetical protein M1821_002119 [Bathelium mastoideum]
MAVMQNTSSTINIQDEGCLEVQLKPAVELQSLVEVATSPVEAVDSCNCSPDESEDQTSQRPHQSSNSSSRPPSRNSSARNLGQAYKAKAKQIFRAASKSSKRGTVRRHYKDNVDQYSRSEENILGHVRQNPAFNPSQLVRKQGPSVTGTVDSTYGVAKSTLHAVAHPKRAIKAKAARKLATPEHPYLSSEANLQFLDTHERMSKLQSPDLRSSDDASSDLEYTYGELEKKIQALELDREQARVAWITSRHIFRVRVVPKRQLGLPVRSDYYERQNDGKPGKFRYERYIGAMMLYFSQDFTSQYIDDFDTLPFNKDTLIRHFERLVMVSGPWQAWFVNLRRIYRWENPKKTMKWLVIMLIVWYYNHYCYLVFITIRRRFCSETAKDIRTSYDRALSRGTQALRISELISKHGNDKWLDPLLDEIGPIVQLQIGDLADLLEIYQNCYDWIDPWMTVCTLLFLMTCVLVGHFASTEFSVKVLEWIGILYFFFSRPVSSLYPRYRHIVSPLKWTVWDIPTHAEWAFRHLRREAQKTRAAMIEHCVTKKYMAEEINPVEWAYGRNLELSADTRTTTKYDEAATGYASDDSLTSYKTAASSSNAPGANILLSFRCCWRGWLGRLVLHSTGLEFSYYLAPRSGRWSRSYLEMVEMRKRSTDSHIARIATVETLQLFWTDGTMDEITETRGKRDEIFNCILGFSGLRWQALQPLADGLKTAKKRETERDHEAEPEDNASR